MVLFIILHLILTTNVQNPLLTKTKIINWFKLIEMIGTIARLLIELLDSSSPNSMVFVKTIGEV